MSTLESRSVLASLKGPARSLRFNSGVFSVPPGYVNTALLLPDLKAGPLRTGSPTSAATALLLRSPGSWAGEALLAWDGTGPGQETAPVCVSCRMEGIARPGAGGTFGETEAGARPGVSASQTPPSRPLGTARVPRWTPSPSPCPPLTRMSILCAKNDGSL